MSADHEWTPPTHLIKAAWTVLRAEDPDDVDPTRQEAGAEFDRWLAGRDAEAGAKALDEFATWVEANGGEDAWAYSVYAQERAAELRAFTEVE